MTTGAHGRQSSVIAPMRARPGVAMPCPFPGRPVMFNRHSILADMCAGRPTLFSSPALVAPTG